MTPVGPQRCGEGHGNAVPPAPRKTKPPRLFAALPLPLETRERLAEAGAHLADLLPEARLRVVPPENMHLTLRYFGEAPPEAAETLENELRPRIAEEASRLRDRAAAPPEIELPRLAALPLEGQARIIWAEAVEGPGCPGFLAALAEAAERAALAAGFEPETRPFTPHLTVARLRRRVPVPPEGLARAAPAGALRRARFPTPEVELLESTLHPDGAVYRRLASFPLA